MYHVVPKVQVALEDQVVPVPADQVVPVPADQVVPEAPHSPVRPVVPQVVPNAPSKKRANAGAHNNIVPKVLFGYNNLGNNPCN